MEQGSIKVYSYRWVVLFVYILVTASVCMQWLTFAPIAREAKEFYHVSSLQIDLLSLVFLAVFVLVAIPASYFIDTFGIRKGIGLGAILLGIFGGLKAFYSHSYEIVFLCQMGLSIAQPFILNAVTRLSVQWFPIHERATAVALGTLAQFFGIIFVMLLTPLLLSGGENGEKIPFALSIFGIISLMTSLLFLLFVKEKPPTSPSVHGEDKELSFREGIRFLWKKKDMRKILFLFLIGLGVFNAISTCIDQICENKGLSIDESGLVAGSMLIAGILGGILIPPLSDRFQKRKVFLIISMAGFFIGLTLFVFFKEVHILYVSSTLIGFFLLGIGAPIGFQYCAEITSPAPESTSQGLLLLVGQVSGILFILGLNYFGMVSFLYILLLFSFLNLILVFYLKESPFMLPKS